MSFDPEMLQRWFYGPDPETDTVFVVNVGRWPDWKMVNERQAEPDN